MPNLDDLSLLTHHSSRQSVSLLTSPTVACVVWSTPTVERVALPGPCLMRSRSLPPTLTPTHRLRSRWVGRTPDVCVCDAGWSGHSCGVDELVTRAKQLLEGHHPRQQHFTSLMFNKAACAPPPPLPRPLSIPLSMIAGVAHVRRPA